MAYLAPIDAPGVLGRYLVTRGHLPAHEEHSIAVSVLAGGVSNRTVLLRREGGEAWVVKQALAKLAVKADWFADPARVHREAEGLRWLGKVLPEGATPRFLFEDEEVHVLGMTAIAPPHENWKTLLLAGHIDQEAVIQFGRLLGRIHGVGREDLLARKLFSDRSFFESLRLAPYYEHTAYRSPPLATFIRALVDETRAIQDTVVHGDYSPKNVLSQAGRLVLLDHEVIHFGDGAFDVGFALTHFLSKANHVIARRADFAAAAQLFWSSYVEVAGATAAFEARAVRHTLACLAARVLGRSPLEYQGEDERERQIAAVSQLVAKMPSTINAGIAEFIAQLH